MVARTDRYSITEYLRFWLRYARAWWRWKTRPLSPEEKAERKQRESLSKQKRATKRQLTQEAMEYAKLIRQRLTRMGHCYRYKKHETDWLTSGVQEIRFDRVAVSQDAIWLRIDGRRIPRDVQIRNIIDEKILDELSLSCRRKVQAKRDIDSGAWFIIDRGTGARGIPMHVSYADVLSHYPKTAGPLVIPAGKGENGRMRWIDLDNNMTPHLLVGGATGQGKSVFVNNVLCSLIQRNSPDRLKLLMIDLKIVELTFYRGIPHLLDVESRTIEGKDGENREISAIVTEREDVTPLLKIAYNEVQRRLKMFEGRARDIGEWNRKHRSNPLPYWLVVVDEIANIMLDKGRGGLAGPAEQLFSDIAARGRAPGIHLIIATQRPSTDVVTGLIKANFPARVAFACASQVDSRTIIDVGEAWGLEPPGRMILARGADREQIQGPYVSTQMVENIVRDIKGGKIGISETRAKHDVTEEDILLYAIREMGGDFTWRKLFDKFGPMGVTVNEIKTMGQRLDGQIVEIDGKQFKMEPSKGGSDPRRLVPMGYGTWDEELENRLHPDNGSHFGTPAESEKDSRNSFGVPEPLLPEAHDTHTTPTAESQGTPIGVPEPLLLSPPESHDDDTPIEQESFETPEGGNGASPKRKKRQQQDDLWK